MGGTAGEGQQGSKGPGCRQPTPPNRYSCPSPPPTPTLLEAPTPPPAGAYASRQSVDYAAWRQEAPPPAEVPPSWDPQACWLVSPETPALPAAPAAAAASVSTAPFTAATHGFAAPPGSAAAGPGAPGTSGKPRTGFAGAWARLKQRFARSPRRGRGAARGSDDRELLGAAAPIPTPGTATSSSSRQHSTLLHTTGSVPALPRQPQPPARRQSLAGQPSHIPKPPLPPSARRHSISTTPGPLPGSSSHSSSTPSSASRLLPPVFSGTSSSGVNGGFAPAPLAPSWQQQQGGRGLAHSAGAAAAATEAAGARGTPASDDGTARRLVFSPPPSRAERPATQPMPISSLYQRTEWYMQPSHRQQPPGGHPSLHQQQQQEQQQQQAAGQPAWPPRPGGTSASHGSGVPRLVTPRLSFECMAPAAGPAAAIGPPLPLADLLAVPPEMLGAWVRESEGGGGGGGGRASVHALLQLPALQAAVWEQMQELQVCLAGRSAGWLAGWLGVCAGCWLLAGLLGQRISMGRASLRGLRCLPSFPHMAKLPLAAASTPLFAALSPNPQSQPCPALPSPASAPPPSTA